MDWASKEQPNKDFDTALLTDPTIIVANLELENIDKWVKDNYLPLFEHFLLMINDDEDWWPKNLSPSLFKKWFHVTETDEIYSTDDF